MQKHLQFKFGLFHLQNQVIIHPSVLQQKKFVADTYIITSGSHLICLLLKNQDYNCHMY